MIRTPAPRTATLRIDTPDVTVRNTVRERWIHRLWLFASVAWYAWVITLNPWNTGVLLASNIGLILVGLLWTARFIAGKVGAPIVGVRVPGRPGTVVFDDGIEVETDGRSQRFAGDEIASGWTESFAGYDDVVLRMRDGAVVRWRARDAEEARAALQAMGIAPAHRAVTLRLGVADAMAVRAARILYSFVVTFAGLAACAGGIIVAARTHWTLGAVTVGVSVVSTGIFLARMLAPLVTSTVHIGTDGIVIERLFRRRFIPRASFRGVCVQGNEIAISALHESPAGLRVSGADEAVIVARRIEEAMTQHDSSDAATQAQLDRGGRPIEAWLREVRALARGASGYRDAKLDREELYAVVADGAAPAERRIAAAAALADHDEGMARARIAAHACADDRLRIAIEEATEDEVEEAKIEGALRVEERQRNG